MASPQISVWFFTPEEKNIQVINAPQDIPLEWLREKLDCRYLDVKGFTDEESGFQYLLFMDDDGLLKQEVYNECASKCLGRIKLLFQGHPISQNHYRLGGKYLVVCVKNPPSGNYVDMPADMTPKRFINLFNESLKNKPPYYPTDKERMMAEAFYKLRRML